LCKVIKRNKPSKTIVQAHSSVAAGKVILYPQQLSLKKIVMPNLIEEFNSYRTAMNEVILAKDNLVIKRLWNLDTNTYAAGALDVKTKELLGLVASMVLRCDDCIKYHLGKAHEQGVSTEELYEVFAVANIVGGTIVVPHTRRAAEYWEALQQ
jgi:AhpD family alkylhydroperoxidase